MANNKFGVGVRKLGILPITAETANAKPTYGAALDVPSTNAVKVSRSTASATADGDDMQVANITMTTGATIEWTGWGVPDETSAKLYGHTYEDGEVIESMSDLAPYVGVHYIRTTADNTNKQYFKAYCYFKCQAVQGDEESTTSGTSLSLASETVKFNAVEPAVGGFRAIQEFETETEAVAWIKEQFGIS